MSDHDFLFKIVIVGDANTGKTSLLRRYVDDEFVSTTLSTIGIDFKIKSLELENRGKKYNVKLQLWDTAGQERYNSISKSYAHNAHGIVLVFAYDNLQSLQHIDKWYDDMYSVLEGAKPKPHFLLVGNKSDLDNKSVTRVQLDEFMQGHEFMQLDTSAKTGENVYDMFQVLARECLMRFCTLYDNIPQNKDTLRLTEFPNPETDEIPPAKKCC